MPTDFLCDSLDLLIVVKCHYLQIFPNIVWTTVEMIHY